MPDLVDLVRRYTTLADDDLDWLRLLVGEWQLLADLSFADLLLWVRTSDPAGFIAVAQIRPVTAQTAYVEDKVGQRSADGKRILVDRARARSENTIRRATNELRRIQTDRQITSETFHKKEIPHIGLTSMKEVVVSLQNQNKVKLLLRKIQGQDDFAEVMAPPDPAFFEFFNTHFAAKQTQPAAA